MSWLDCGFTEGGDGIRGAYDKAKRREVLLATQWEALDNSHPW